MNLRSTTFWVLDSLAGSSLRKELQDVRNLNDRSENSTKRRLELLDEQLAFVNSKVPYYRTLSGLSSLADFPVLTKEDIRSNQSEMLADGVDPDSLHVASTSGSTGTPFRIFHNKEKRRRINAEAVYFGNLAGYQIGNLLWHLKIWTARNSYSRLGALAKNVRPVDVGKFDGEEVKVLLDKIREGKGEGSIIAYSSSLETIAKTIQAEGGSGLNLPRVVSIIGQSEPLSQEARNILFKALGTYPVGRYGMEEAGILAQQEVSLDGTYRMNLASHVVEVLKSDSDERASEGETGRVVVTDLFNKAQPLIRYETGDLAVVGARENGTDFVESLSRLDGRGRERIYDVDDQPLAPMIAYNFWWKYPEIIQYQIVQRGRGHYLLRVDVSDSFDRESYLVEDFSRQVGSTARVEVEYSASDYRLASGKRRVIVSEYAPPSVD